MKILLLFPPGWHHYSLPYLSLPSLSAYLERDGFPVSVRDLNIEHFHFTTTSEGLERRMNWIEAERDALSRRTGLRDRALYELLSRVWLLSPAVGACEDMKTFFRAEEAFYDVKAHGEATVEMHRILASLFRPVTELLAPFAVSSSRLTKIAEDGEKNPYLPYFRDLLPSLSSGSPELAGISVATSDQVVPAFTLAGAVKEAMPGTRVVMGGPMITRLIGPISRAAGLFSLADYFVRGEGEAALGTLARVLADGREPADVPGLLYFQGGSVREGGPPSRIETEVLPAPGFDGLPMEKYLSPGPVLPYATSRGCPWGRCTFCTGKDLEGPRWRSKSVGKVLDDMEVLCGRHGTRIFYFTDNLIPPSYLFEMGAEMEARDLDVTWTCQTRPGPGFHKEGLERIARAGCANLQFGLESGSKRVLGLMDKGIDPEEAERVFALCSDAGISIHLYCMFGFPGETEEESRETVRLLNRARERCAGTGITVTLQSFVLSLGSDVGCYPEAFGLGAVSEPRGEDFSDLLREKRVAVDFSVPSPAASEMPGRILSARTGLQNGPDRGEVNLVHGLFYRRKFGSAHAWGRPARHPGRHGRELVPSGRERPERSGELRFVEIKCLDGEPGRQGRRWLVGARDPRDVVEIGEEEKRFLDLCDGRYTIEEIVAELATPTSAAQVHAYAALFAGKGILTFKQEDF